MPASYLVLPGDTFDSVARSTYGAGVDAGRVASANPGVYEPLVPGTVLILPTAPNNVAALGAGVDKNAVQVGIDGATFSKWTDIRIRRAIDTVDSVSLSVPFDPSLRSIFKPFKYQGVTVSIGGEGLFTGTCVSISTELTSTDNTLVMSSYSRAGVLNDCTPPASAYPLEFNRVTLRTISERLAEPFAVGVTFESDPGPVFERVACDPGKRVLTFLSELAKQRNLVIASDSTGGLVFRSGAASGAPRAVLAQGAPPLISVRPEFDAQQYYSHITGLEPVLVGSTGAQYTARNPLLTGVLRPLTFNATDTEGAGAKGATEAKLGYMFGNMARYQIAVATWRDSAGELWTPNTIISLVAPGAMIYAPYNFLIAAVEFYRSSNDETATLDLVLPGAYSGAPPESLPWDE